MIYAFPQITYCGYACRDGKTAGMIALSIELENNLIIYP